MKGKYSSKLHFNVWDHEGRHCEYSMCVIDDNIGDIDLYFNDTFLGTFACYSDAISVAEDHAAKNELNFEVPF